MLQRLTRNWSPFLVFFSLTWWHLLISIVHADTIIPYGKPNIDGNLAGGEWSEWGHVRMARFYGFDQFADFWLQWDNDNLYIAGWLDDFTLFEDGGGNGPWANWHDDSVEIYFHPSANPPTAVNEQSRILAFSVTGKYQRLDRGRWGNEATSTAGLEIIGNTNPKIGNDFLNKPIRWVDDCKSELNTPSQPDVTVRFASQAHGTLTAPNDRDQGWQFEMALPWRLMGTTIGKKIIGANCSIGDAVIPSYLKPTDGMPISINFYRINDDQGGEVKPGFTGTFQDKDMKTHGNGIMVDEWFVYQGDRNRPNEWATFILSGKTDTNDVPRFESPNLRATAIDGHRVRLEFNAPTRGNVGGSVNRYEIGVQEGNFPADETVWRNHWNFENAYQPAAPNTLQALEVLGLQPNKTYTIALRAKDELERSSAILTTVVTTPANDHPFITVSPTGRTLVFTDGSPFLVVGETGLMPWLPLRGLYTGDLCEEHPPTDPNFLAAAKSCGNGGKIRNYSKENYFYTCYFNNGKTVDVTDITAFGKDSNYGPQDNCEWAAKQAGTSVKAIEAKEGSEVAELYLNKLKNAGVNVLTVFVESLDLNVTPIIFEKNQTDVFNFLDRLLELARDNEVYLIIRLYDSYYYRSKWSQTFWASRKNSPEGFFDADIYNLHQERMKQLFSHVHPRTRVAYRDEPHILGWDILNEIDNSDRFNDASYEQHKKWLETMLDFARREVPKQLVFYSFLGWEPKDDAEHYRANLKMDAELAYRVRNAQLAVPHGYYARIANPYADPTNLDFEGPLELARGTIYGFHQIRDGRPLLDGESGPSPLFVTEGNAFGSRFDANADLKRFMDVTWLHFVAGGAGASLQWPIDLYKSDRVNQISQEKRAFLATFKKKVGDILWRGNHLQIAQRKLGERLVQLTRYDGRSALVYLYNQDKVSISEMTLADLPITNGRVTVVNPSTGKVLYESASVAVGEGKRIVLQEAANESVAAIVRDLPIPPASSSPPTLASTDSCRTSSATGGVCITDNVWIKGVIYTEEKGAIEAVWKFGGDAKTPRGDRVIWGYLYANPADVGWGNPNNPEAFVKIWYDVTGRVDINFFHVSVPEIEVISAMKEVTDTPVNRITTLQRYARHEYNTSQRTGRSELINTREIPGSTPQGNPTHNLITAVQNVQIGATIQTTEKGNINGVWRVGGADTTPRGDQVAWGFFYANPQDVSWGLADNPEVYVKVWYDVVAKRLDINFFHVSVPNVQVNSGFADGHYDNGSAMTTGDRYTRHVYQR
jgi:hypothetical protein